MAHDPHMVTVLCTEQSLANCWPLESGIVPLIPEELSGGTPQPGSGEGLA